VNIPNTFGSTRRLRPYTPDDFKKTLIERIKISEPLKQLSTAQETGGRGGDWCVAIKKINGERIEEVKSYSSVRQLVFTVQSDG
jgi:hypothetical protein